MKIFRSGQSDTLGNIGRHVVRGALTDAINELKEPEEVEEPLEREVRESLHLDDDRKGASGSPDLAPAVSKRIEQAAVFVANVTLVGQIAADTNGKEGAGCKKLINSNVAIEYGYALHALTDTAILMVQNRHYGERDELPFELKHKACPIQFTLAPGASRIEITAERGLWGTTRELFIVYRGELIIPARNVENIFRKVLANYAAVAGAELGGSCSLSGGNGCHRTPQPSSRERE